MKIAWVLCLVMACGGNDNSRHVADGNGSGSGDGSGVPEPCNMMISSTKITTTATGTQCGQQLVNRTTFAINFSVMRDASNMAISEIASTITPGVVPQARVNRSGATGCNVEVDYYGPTGDDEWDNSSSGALTVTVTDLRPPRRHDRLSLSNGASQQLTVIGTF